MDEREKKKQLYIIMELRPNRNKPHRKMEDIIKDINIVPLYGGYFNINLNYEIGIELPDDIEFVRRKMRKMSFNENGLMEIEEDIL